MIAGVGHGSFPANRNTIPVGEHILDFDMKVRACSAEVTMDSLEGFGSQ